MRFTGDTIDRFACSSFTPPMPDTGRELVPGGVPVLRPVSRALALALLLALGGCYVQEVPQTDEERWDAPRKTVADVKAHGDENGDVLLADLAAAHGLTIKLDRVTGKRVLEDSTGNKVVVSPGNRSVVINGTEYPLAGEIRWKAGQIYCPGDAPVVFGEHLRHQGVQEVAGKDSFAYLDTLSGVPVQQGAVVRQAAPVHSAPIGHLRIDPNAPPLPASWNMSSRAHTWSYIVIHHSATNEGGAASFNRAHSKKWENGLGYHFVIGNGTETADGEIEVGPRWLRQNQGIDGAHAGVEKYNKHGIGICLVGDFDHQNPTPKQLAALRNLIQHLMQKYGIPRDHIIPHRAVKVGHTECPGTHFPLELILQSL
jgi:hypothetical protein